jgi:hypothetical protein
MSIQITPKSTLPAGWLISPSSETAADEDEDVLTFCDTVDDFDELETIDELEAAERVDIAEEVAPDMFEELFELVEPMLPNVITIINDKITEMTDEPNIDNESFIVVLLSIIFTS